MLIDKHTEYQLAGAGSVDVIRDILNRRAWEWFDEHQDDVVIQFLWIKKRWRDLRSVWVMLFGEPKLRGFLPHM